MPTVMLARYKMTKEMGRWVEYFEKAEAEKGYAVRKVPAWVKAVHLINWDFENLNETHRLEDMDDDEEDEEDDDDEEEGADDEEGDGLMPGTLMWELPRAEIAGKPELQEEGYPAVSGCERNSPHSVHFVTTEARVPVADREPSASDTRQPHQGLDGREWQTIFSKTLSLMTPCVLGLVPQAVIAAANALAEDLLGDCSNKFVDGYVKPGTFDFIKIKQMPPPVEIYKGIEPRDEEDEEEAEMTEEEKEMLIAATVITP